MSRLICAELRKLATVRTSYGLGVVILVLTLAWAASVLAAGGQVGAVPLGTPESMARVLAAPGADAAVFVLGALLAAGEIRHHTITTTFLMTPRRGRVIAAKLAAAGAAGAAAAVLSTGAALALALPWLAAQNVPIDLASRALVLGVLGHGTSLALFGLLGVGVGTLLRNQLAAVLGGLLWLYAVEPLFIAGTFPALVPWLPTGAVVALSHGELRGALALPQWAGGLLLLAYALALAAAGTRLITRQDIA